MLKLAISCSLTAIQINKDTWLSKTPGSRKYGGINRLKLAASPKILRALRLFFFPAKVHSATSVAQMTLHPAAGRFSTSSSMSNQLFLHILPFFSSLSIVCSSTHIGDTSTWTDYTAEKGEASQNIQKYT